MSYMIGIAGGSGSGKSTFARKLKERFEGRVTLISCDNYYLPHDDIPFEEREKLNYDSPDAFQFDLMFEHLQKLKEGQDVECPVYDFARHTRSKETVTAKTNPIIIVDGILIFGIEKLREIMDLRIYVEADSDERILRRARRDICERGRDFDGIVKQYLETVKPMHSRFVEPTKIYADIIINGGINPKALDLVGAKIEKILL